MKLPARATTAARALAPLAIILPAALAAVPLPHGALFLAALAAVEWGHWLVPPAILVIAARVLRHRRFGCVEGLLVLSAAILAWPAWSAWDLAADLPAAIDTGLGVTGGADDAGFSILRLYTAPDGGPPEEIDGGKGRRYDLYRPAQGEPAALVVMVHGGSWRGGDRHQLPDVDRDLAARGLAVLEIDYSLAPDHPFPAALEDVYAALAWVRQEGPGRGLDPARVILAGRSAGAQLALLAGYSPDAPLKPRGVVGLYGPTDLVWGYRHPGPKSILDTHAVLGDYLGGPLDQRASTYERASPLLQVRADAPPTLLVHGARDRLVSPYHGHRLAGVLAHLGVPYVQVVLPWGRHGCEANPRGPGGQVVLAAIERFARAVCR